MWSQNLAKEKRSQKLAKTWEVKTRLKSWDNRKRDLKPNCSGRLGAKMNAQVLGKQKGRAKKEAMKVKICVALLWAKSERKTMSCKSHGYLKCFIHECTKETKSWTFIISISKATFSMSSPTPYLLRSLSVFKHVSNTCRSSWISLLQSHTRSSTSIRAHRPVSIFRWCELRRNLVKLSLSRSFTYSFDV